MVIRFWLLTTNYRQPINFTREIIEGAKNSLDRINNAYFRLKDLSENNTKIELISGEEENLKILADFKNKFIEVMDNDLNTADAITVLFDLVKFANSKIDANNSKYLIEKTLDYFNEFEEVLGLENRKKSKANVDEKQILELIELRNQAKINKNYKEADEIRDQLKDLGVSIKDTRDGVKWELI